MAQSNSATSKRTFKLDSLTKLDADKLLSLDIMKYRMHMNELLLKTSLHIRNELMCTITTAQNKRKLDYRGVDWMGKKLKGKDLRGANLSTSMFLTQMQINSAKGNMKTQLPPYLTQPSHWSA